MTSLRLRLLALTSLLLTVSFAVLGAAIDRSFMAALESAQRDLLESQVITLLAVAQSGPEDTLDLPYDMPEPRLNAPVSGLYAKIRLQDGTIFWRSSSSLGVDLTPPLPLPNIGQRVFSEQQTSNDETLTVLSLGVVWQFENDDERYFAFSVAESRKSLDQQMVSFRGQLYLAFFVIALVLLVAMAVLLSLLLRPLGQIESEIEAVESGQREHLSSNYPSELSGVARNLNALLDSEQKRVTRYQQTLANLAHSLKTPLAAARSLLSTDSASDVQHELDRMQDIVRYQLARPAAAGGRRIGRGAVALVAEVESLLNGLDKVYRAKAVSAEIVVEDGLMFHGDRGDLVEVLGNVLDNAYKWCKRRVLLEAEAILGDGKRPGLQIIVSDDGAGIPAEAAERALQRGQRLDESIPGTGIGLSVVNEMLTLYEGQVFVERSADLGGASIRLVFPPV